MGCRPARYCYAPVGTCVSISPPDSFCRRRRRCRTLSSTEVCIRDGGRFTVGTLVRPGEWVHRLHLKWGALPTGRIDGDAIKVTAPRTKAGGSVEWDHPWQTPVRERPPLTSARVSVVRRWCGHPEDRSSSVHRVGEIRNKWNELGGSQGALGYPVSDEIDVDGVKVSTFERGSIYFEDGVVSVR